jgi:hypothetical protein
LAGGKHNAMKCPHCLVAFHDESKERHIGTDADGDWVFIDRTCPNCKRFVFELSRRGGGAVRQVINYLIHPRHPNRSPLPPEVPQDYASDYAEACLVLADSAKASAALSRRCLQHLLRTEAKVKPGNLADEIQQVIDSCMLPTHLTESLDGIRNIGNFAAHPIKSKSSGEIVEVEPGEAEWNLDVLESLFDFYFVQPASLKKKRDALNKKLADAGKPPMK